VDVPDVVGLAQAAAETAITGAGLDVGTVTTENSDTVAAGDVISQDPVAGTSVPVGSAVDLVVSSGPAPPATGWVAYNDCVYDADTNSYIGSNVTTFGIGSSFGGSTFGELLDQATGNPTGVIATLAKAAAGSGNPVPLPAGMTPRLTPTRTTPSMAMPT
jgi:hypothetical protein